MFESRQIAVILIEGKCRRFPNSSECLNTHCFAKNRPIWTQKVPKEALRCGLQTSIRGFLLNIWFYMNSRLSKIRSVHTYGYAPDGLFWLNLYVSSKELFANDFRNEIN